MTCKEDKFYLSLWGSLVTPPIAWSVHSGCSTACYVGIRRNCCGGDSNNLVFTCENSPSAAFLIGIAKGGGCLDFDIGSYTPADMVTGQSRVKCSCDTAGAGLS